MTFRFSAPWTKEAPTLPGEYHTLCSETGHIPHPVRVIRNNGELWVDCLDTGKNPLNRYHANLCNLEWRLVS